MRPKVYVTRRIPAKGLELIEAECEMALHEPDSPPSREEIIANVRDRDGLLCLLTDRIDREVIEAGSNLRVISTYSAGFEHIDIAEATKRGIYVGYTPGVLTEATADLTFALILGAARRVSEADRFIREHKWKISWHPTFMLGEGVWEKTLGIIGMGRIGHAVAKRARGFNMRILYNNRHRISNEEEATLGAEYVILENLLRESDFVTIHTPLTDETHHLINEERLRLMKPHSILVNTSRGKTVDIKALIKALREGWIGGAGLDVYPEEPIEEDNPLPGIDNAVLLPHIGSATRDAREEMAVTAAKNLLAVFRGELPRFLVNP